MKSEQNRPLFGLLPLIIILLGGCVEMNDRGYEAANGSTPVTSALLESVLSGLSENGVIVGGVAGNLTTAAMEPGLYCQFFSESQYTRASRYRTSLLNWDPYYKNSLQDLATIIEYNSAPVKMTSVVRYGANKNQLAIARILKAYFFWHVTDRWGDAPYFGALKKDPRPLYTPQKFIYYDFFKELGEANEQFDTSAAAFEGDILFNGNVRRWRMFSNSLRILMALRISEVDPEKAQAEFVKAKVSPWGYVETNQDNICFPFAKAGLENPWKTINLTDAYGISDYLLNVLKQFHDPRLEAYAFPTVNGEFIGLPYGLTPDSLIEWISQSHYSRLGSKLTSETFAGFIITAAEIQFALSEAALKNWIPDDPTEHYNLAIRQSFEQWGVYSGDVYNNYIAQQQVQLNRESREKDLQKIGNQRWLALYPNGFEAWCEWRRTNIPQLIPTPFAINASKQIPVRYVYPGSEQSLNPENYSRAVSGLAAGDTQDSKVWWDCY